MSGENNESENYDRKWRGDAVFTGKHGIFRVDNQNGKSVPVHFIQSNISFTDDVMGKLETFREIFDTESLSLEQILQRDIDDTRVSTEMIPYLLSSSYQEQTLSQGKANFYPPVVAILVPIEEGEDDQGEPITVPAQFYSAAFCAHTDGELGYNDSFSYGPTKSMNYFAKISEENKALLEKNRSINVDYHMVSGVAEENHMFKLVTPANVKIDIEGNYTRKINDLKSATLEINTDRCKVVIIDGQHRAMSMLALYRNSRSSMWDGSRKPYEVYYREWKKKMLEQYLGYNLNSLVLPFTVCFVPDGMSGGIEEAEIQKVARQIFLTLNKTAKPVDEIHNQIMNDGDMTSELMREQLQNFYDSDRKWINLIVHGHQEKVTERALPIHMTSTDMIYRIIRNIAMVPLDWTNYVEPRKNGKGMGSIAVRNNLNRLLAPMKVSKRLRDSTKRNKYTRANRNIVVDKFSSDHAKIIYKLFDEVELFSHYNIEMSELNRFRDNPGYTTAISMIENGNNKQMITEHYFETIQTKREKLGVDTAGKYLTAIIEEMSNTLSTFEVMVEHITSKQHDSLVQNLTPEQSEACKRLGIVENILKFGTEIMTQVGIVVSFFDVLDKVETAYAENDGKQNIAYPLIDLVSETGKLPYAKGSENHSQLRISLCEEYIGALNTLFSITDINSLNRICKIFRLNQISYDGDEYTATNKDSPLTELFQDKKSEAHYPHYSLIFNILWYDNTSNEFISNYLDNWIDIALKSALQKAYQRKVRVHKKEFGDDIEDDVKSDYADGLISLISSLLEELNSSKKDNFDNSQDDLKTKLIAEEDLIEISEDEDDAEDEDDDEDEDNVKDGDDSQDESEAVLNEAEGVDERPPEAQDGVVPGQQKGD